MVPAALFRRGTGSAHSETLLFLAMNIFSPFLLKLNLTLTLPVNHLLKQGPASLGLAVHSSRHQEAGWPNL